MKSFNVAVDGPSGVGKSSISDAIAHKYGLIHLDTGAMYRAVALALDEQGVEPAESQELQDALNQIDLVLNDKQVLLNGQDVTAQIRQPHVSMLASSYSALPSVRRFLVASQQKIAARKGFILDGRDICDVVLPDAEVKLYLDASAKARANRRCLQLEQAGITEPFEKILEEIELRDLKDRTRKTDPLKISDNAVVIDTSNLSLEQVIDLVSGVIERRN